MAIIVPIVSNFNKKGITDATAALSQLGNSLKSLGAQVSFAAFMSSSINQARDLQRNIAALEGVFGSYSDRMKQFTVDAQGFGLSQTEAARTTVFLGSVLKAAGFGMEEVSAQTEKLTMLAQDLATTYGYDTSEALTAMTALFRGEYDPIEKFGVALKQNEINALIAAKGLDHLTGVEMLNAQQMVRMEQLYLRTNDAQGAYARQSDSLFVSQKNLTAAFKNLQANAAQPLTIALGKLFAGMAPLVDQAGPGLTQTFTQFADIILSLTPLLTPLATLAGVVGAEFNNLVAVLGTLIRELVGPLTSIITVFTNLLVGLFGWVQQNAGAIAVWTTALVGTYVAVKALSFAWMAFQAVSTVIGIVTVAVRTMSVAVAGYMSTVAGATMAQALFDIALGAINPAALVIGLAVIGTGIALIANEAMNAKFNLDQLNVALQTTANSKIPGQDFSGGASVGLAPYKIKNPMDGTTTTWLSGGKWYTATFTNGKWSNPKEYKAVAAGVKGSGAVIRNGVQDFYGNLTDEVKKQSALATLTGKKFGLSTALAESIVGSGEDWAKVFANVKKLSKTEIANLQNNFNKTKAGLAEQKQLLEDAKQAAKEKYQADMEIYRDQKAAYDAQIDAIKSLKKSLSDAASATVPLAIVTRNIGQFENNTISAFDSIAEAISAGVADGVLLKSAADKLTEYARKEQATIQGLMRQRDEISEKRSLAKAMLQDVRDAVVGMQNITNLLGNQAGDITQSVTKMVGKVQVTTSKVIKGIIGGGPKELVASFGDIVARTKVFANQLKELRELGLNKNLYQQIVDAGIDAGGTTAKAILEGGAGTVGELNNLFNELDVAGQDIAKNSAEVMYGAGVDLTNGLIEGLISQEQQLIDTATKLAEAFTTAFNSQVNVSVPIPTAPIMPNENDYLPPVIVPKVTVPKSTPAPKKTATTNITNNVILKPAAGIVTKKDGIAVARAIQIATKAGTLTKGAI